MVSTLDNEADHEVLPDFRGSPHHYVAGPQPFVQPAVEPLRHGPLLAAHRLMGVKGITSVFTPFFSMMGMCLRFPLL